MTPIAANPAPGRPGHPWLRRLCLGIGVCGLHLAGAGNTLAGPWHAHEANTPGWRYLTPPERVEHQRRLRGFSTLRDCKAYLERHHRLLAERARARGESFGNPEADTCDELRRRGRLR